MSTTVPPPPEPDAGAFERVGLTDASREQMERYRTAHHTQVLTILLSDLEGSTQQQSTLGNVRAAELVRAHREVFRKVLARMDGQEVETAGDSFLVVFATPSEAVKFALQMQAAMRAARATEPDLPRVRVGIHQGQVVVERHEEGPKRLDVYGLQISTAARIADLARGGQVLCSRAVFDDARAILSRDDLAGLEAVAWCNHGPYRFKGVSDSHEVCEVGERGHAPLAPPVATAKAWPAEQADEELGWRPAVGVVVPGTSWVLEERLGKEGTPAGSAGFSPYAPMRPEGRRANAGGQHYRGEFGEVWRAFNPADRSRQVFKFCFRREHLHALKREARLLKRLHRYRHPNIVEVYDVTEGDKPPYYLEMEYVEGPSLEEWLATNPPLSERLGIVAQIADALDTVHAAGIYHRDIKPSNILLARREDGALVAKLSDFGLGAAQDDSVLRSLEGSRSDTVAGTWDYIAPELRHGAPPSPQSDLYSLGLTLYQIVCGDLTRTLGDWERHVPSEVLREDIARCIATDPAARWASAAELSRALRSHDERLRERQLRREREAQRRRIKRLGAITGLAAAAAVVLAALGAYAFVQRRIARRHEAQARRDRDEAVEARRRTEAELYFSNTLLATRQIEQHRYDLALDTLWGSPEHLRDWEWGHLLARCSTDLCTLDPSTSLGARAHGQQPLLVAFSPDGARLIAGTKGGNACVWDVRTGRQELALAAHAGWLSAAAFDPTGARLLTAADADGVARLWDARTGKPLVELSGHCPALIIGPPDAPHLAEGSRATLAEAWAGRGEKQVYDSVMDRPFAVRIEGGPPNTFQPVRRELLAGIFILLGESRGIVAASFAPAPRQALGAAGRPNGDGLRVLTAGGDGTARLWDAASGRCVHILPGRARREPPPGGRFASVEAVLRWLADVPLTTAVFSPDGTRVATGAHDGTVEVWDAATGALVWSVRDHKAPVAAIAFSPDGQRLASAPGERAARAWEPWLARETSEGSKTSEVSAGTTVWVRDAATGRPLVAIGCPATSCGVAFVANGAQIVTAHREKEGMGVLWDAASGQLVRAFAGRPLLPVEEGAWVVAAVPGGAAIIEVATGRAAVTFGGHSSAVNAAAFLPLPPGDGTGRAPGGARRARVLATASDDGTVKLWEVTSPSDPARPTRHTFHIAQQAFRAPGAAGIDSVALSRDGSRLAALAGRRAWVWDTATGATVATLSQGAGLEPGFDLSPDGRRLVAPVPPNAAVVWDTDSGRVICTYDGHAGAVQRARFSPDGTRVATASADRTAHIWDATTGRVELRLTGHTNIVWDACFSPDGARVATTSGDRTARIWDARSGDLLATLRGHTRGLNNALFSADGARLATGAADRTARVWDTRAPHAPGAGDGAGHGSGVLLATLQEERGSPFRFAFSPDATRLLTAGPDIPARLWDIATGVPIHTFGRNPSQLGGADLNPAGTRAVTVDDIRARVWDTASGRDLVALEGHTRPVTHVAFSADGRWVATAGEDGAVRLWRAAPWRAADVPGDPGQKTWRQRFALWRLDQYRRWQEAVAR